MRNLLDTTQIRQVSYTNRNHYTEPQTHPDRTLPDHDLLLMTKGSWRIGQDETEYEIQEGDAVLLLAGHRHYGPSLCQPETENCFLHFTPLPGDRLSENAGQTRSHQLSLPVVIPCGSRPMVPYLMEEILRAFWGPLPDRALRCSHLLGLLLCELALPQDRQAPANALANRAMTLIHAAGGRFLSIDELAGPLNVSRRTLTARFKEATGLSVHRYQLEQKLTAARLRLRHEDHFTLREIALNLGFYDEFHLSRLYKRRFGAAPSQDRGRMIYSVRKK